jgi:hypothetical protein
LDEEVRTIQEMIRKSQHRDSITFESRWTVRPMDILQAINELDPDVIHFSGHGADTSELVLENADGTAKLVTKEAITQTIMTSSDKIRLMFFNACYSQEQAQTVIEYVDAAIGMTASISDIGACAFAAQFYSSLGMVVTGGIERAIEYYYAINRCLKVRKSPYKPIIAFSGDKEYGGKILNEALINGFPSNAIEKTFRQDLCRFLVAADKFQTGYDEPLLHTMYVDKILTGIKAVQTLSRLNRATPGKIDTFILDFANEAHVIQEAFSRYYRTSILSGETDPNKLYDLIAAMETHQVYTQFHVDSFVELYLNDAPRDKLDPILDVCVKQYKGLDENSQIEFKASAKGFVRTYGFPGAILSYGNPEWEKLSIFLNLLLPKLPSPVEDDLSQGILDAIDLDSYRAEAKAQMALQLEDADAEIESVPTGGAGGKN